jgi:hypothetical protein
MINNYFRKQLSVAILFVFVIALAFTSFVGCKSVPSTVASASESAKVDNFTWDNALVYFVLTDRFYDGDPTNNCVDNLEWCTASENSTHRNRILQRETGRPKRGVFCLEMGTTFDSSHHAARAMGINQGNIFAVCQGKYKTAGGYHFVFSA